MARLNLNDSRSPYIQIADDLRQAISSGELTPGTQISSVRDLADEYAVSHTTVSHAIKTLRDEGLLVSWQGRGVFVRDPAAEPQPAADQTGYEAIMERLESMHDGMRGLEDRVRALEQRASDLDTPAGQPGA